MEDTSCQARIRRIQRSIIIDQNGAVIKKGDGDMKGTGFKDKNGVEINIGVQVIHQGDKYDVDVNPFNGLPVIDNDCGQCRLSDVHEECEIINA